MKITRPYSVGIIGTGFISKGLCTALNYHPKLTVEAVLTRRSISSIKEFPVKKQVLTNSLSELIRKSDIIVECTGDAIHATNLLLEVLKAGIPVVTMNPELQITTGSYLASIGTIVEAEGDQPGTLAALNLEITSMGFEPIVYGNIKRYLNTNPSKKDMEYWSSKQGISLPMVTAFTDGTKVQIEQALVANKLGAGISCRGLSGIESEDFEDGARRLAEIAESMHIPISDYVLSPNAPAGVFIVAKHDEEQKPFLEYLKLGSGPYYVITKPYHLCHLEIPKTILRVLEGDVSYDFNNGSKPTIQVVAVAKKNLEAGHKIKNGIGSFSVRGEAVEIIEHPQALPITLMRNVTIKRPIQQGSLITFDDVELPQTQAHEIWISLLKKQGLFEATPVQARSQEFYGVTVNLGQARG